jgi:hypothetical protein
VKIEDDILQMKPKRFFEIWKIDGHPPFGQITVLGLSGIFKLNRISAFIWIQLDGSHTVDGIITTLCKHFADMKRSRIDHDVRTILKRMDKDDLITLDYNPLHPFKR